MITLTPDTNVLASGFAAVDATSSVPAQLPREWLSRPLIFVLSEPLIEEVERTLSKPHFARSVSQQARHDAIALLRQRGRIVEPDPRVQGVASHAEDDRIIATAVSGGARFLVTGDHDLLRLGRYQDVTILTVRAFLATLPGLIEEQIQ